MINMVELNGSRLWMPAMIEVNPHNASAPNRDNNQDEQSCSSIKDHGDGDLTRVTALQTACLKVTACLNPPHFFISLPPSVNLVNPDAV